MTESRTPDAPSASPRIWYSCTTSSRPSGSHALSRNMASIPIVPPSSHTSMRRARRKSGQVPDAAAGLDRNAINFYIETFSGDAGDALPAPKPDLDDDTPPARYWQACSYCSETRLMNHSLASRAASAPGGTSLFK